MTTKTRIIPRRKVSNLPRINNSQVIPSHPNLIKENGEKITNIEESEGIPKGKTYCIADPHGNFRAIKQCLEKVNFDYENDTLISLGDICDGGIPEIYECIEELLKIKHLVNIKGNHDEWFLKFLNTGTHPDNWIQGGYNTAISYLSHIEEREPATYTKYLGYLGRIKPEDVPLSHWKFFATQELYRIIGDRIFVHAGFDRDNYVEFSKKIAPSEFYWDRELVQKAMSCTGDQKLKTKDNFSEIYIGHTTTLIWDSDKPLYRGGVWNLDTGAGEAKGKLTIMDIETKEYWQSNTTKELYPNFKPR